MEENLGTTILSAVIVEHLSDVNRMVCCVVQQTRDSLLNVNVVHSSTRLFLWCLVTDNRRQLNFLLLLFFPMSLGGTWNNQCAIVMDFVMEDMGS